MLFESAFGDFERDDKTTFIWKLRGIGNNQLLQIPTFFQVYSDIWKHFTVYPFSNRGNPSDLVNYHPIALPVFPRELKQSRTMTYSNVMIFFSFSLSLHHLFIYLSISLSVQSISMYLSRPIKS